MTLGVSEFPSISLEGGGGGFTLPSLEQKLEKESLS